MNKYEQLIEYVNNGEDAKAEELFHEIVVEKSRDIYESLMDMEEELGGDEADELINDISSDEEGMREDEDEMGEPEIGGDEVGAFGGEESEDEEAEEADLEDRVVDLEDQLDALMAEFDAIVGGEEGEEMGGEEEIGGEEFGGEEEMDMEPEMEEGRFNEAVSLSKVTKGIANSSEEEGVNKKSINNDNSGSKGAVAKPHQKVGEESGRSAPEVKDGDGTTEPNESKVKEPKKSGEDGGVNKKSVNGS